MSILDSIKKLFVTATETAKDAAQKTVETAKVVGAEVADKSGEMLENAGVDKIGAKVLETGAAFEQKAADVFVSVGTRVQEVAAPAAEKAAQVAEATGSAVLEKAGEVGQTIKNAASSAFDRMADYVEEANAAAAAEDASNQPIPPPRQTIDIEAEIVDTPVSTPQVVVSSTPSPTPAAVVLPTIPAEVVTTEPTKVAPVDPTKPKGALADENDFFKKAGKWLEDNNG